MALTVVVAYDISRDQRRAQLAAVLQRWGQRVQRSVFVCTLDDDDFEELLGRALGIIDTKTDSVYAFRQCGHCWSDVRVLGQATVAPPELCWIVL